MPTCFSVMMGACVERTRRVLSVEVMMDGVSLHLCGSLHRGVQESPVLEASLTQRHQSSTKGSDASSRNARMGDEQ
ncbi:rCG42282 [Rattus norvegicus]|uniref:RCG42282 n=1 Tax=Rattus norvegicus TaxID=10116 RepID=A6KG29_RAT|nr:rCG42282 [Rattus norvegicus]